MAADVRYRISLEQRNETFIEQTVTPVWLTSEPLLMEPRWKMRTRRLPERLWQQNLLRMKSPEKMRARR